MATVVFVLFILEVILGRSLYKRNVNPITSFVGVQLIALFLLFGSSFINTSLMTTRVISIYVVSLLCYTIGCIIGSKNKGYLKNEDKEDSGEDENYYQSKILLLGLILLIATLMYWVACIATFGAGNFLQQLLHTRATANAVGVSNIVLYFKMISVFLSPYVLYFIIYFRSKKLINYLILVLTFVSNIAYTRNVLFYIAILDVFVLIYSRPKKEKSKKSKRWILYIAIVAAMYLFFTYTQTEFNKQFNITGTVLGRTVNSGLLTIVSYFSGAMATVDLYLEKIANTPFLGHTLRSFINLLGPFGVSINTASYQPSQWVFIPFQYNTSALQYYVFSEGGWLWTILFFLLYGITHSKAYFWYMNKKSFSGMLLLCFFSWMSVLSVREYIIVRLDTFFYLLFIVVSNLQETGRIKRIRFSLRLKS